VFHVSGPIGQDQAVSTATYRILDIIDDGGVALVVVDEGSIDILDDTGRARVGLGVIFEGRVMDYDVPDHSVTR
jgi:hypothetical protein